MGGSHELVPAFEGNPRLRMPLPKVDERVSGNNPHGDLYHVPRSGTSFTRSGRTLQWQTLIVEWRPVFPRGLVLLLMPLSEPHAGAAAVLVDCVWAGTESSGKIGFVLHAVSFNHNLTLSDILCALKACAWLARVEPQRVRSYRLSLISSGRARRIASAERSGSVVGIAGGLLCSGRISSPRSNPLKNWLISRSNWKVAGGSNSSHALTREINPTFSRRMRARSNSACAIYVRTRARPHPCCCRRFFWPMLQYP